MNNLVLATLSVMQMSALCEKVSRLECPSPKVQKCLFNLRSDLMDLHCALSEEYSSVPLSEMSSCFTPNSK